MSRRPDAAAAGAAAEALRRLSHGAVLGLLLALALAGGSGCAVRHWPENDIQGTLAPDGSLPSTLFMQAFPAGSPCAAARLATAMGISRRGYYVLAQPDKLADGPIIELSCREWSQDVQVWQGEAAAEGSCLAPGVVHLELIARMKPLGDDEEAPSVVFQGRQKVFPGSLDQGCRYDLEPLTELRKRAGEAVGWRFPPGPVDQPGADPRLILQPASPKPARSER